MAHFADKPIVSGTEGDAAGPKDGPPRSGSILRRVIRSSRIRYAVLASAAASLGGFALTITLAHRVSLDDFGNFAVVSAVIILVLGVTRSAISQPLLALPQPRQEMGLATGRASLIGCIVVVPFIAMALMRDDPFLLMTGLGLPGLLLYDTIRTFRVAMVDPRRGFLQDLWWALATLACCALAWFGVIPGFWAYGGWLFSGALIGVAVALRGSYAVRPRWSTSAVPRATSLAFGVDFLVGSGSVIVTTNLLALFAGSSVVAAIRGAGTLFGPATLLIGVLPTLLIPSLRAIHEGPYAGRSAVRVSFLITAVGTPIIAVIAYLPDPAGQAVLGNVWSLAQPLVPLLAIDVLAILVLTVPLTGHRALLAGGTSLLLRTVLSTFRTLAVVWAGAALGAYAASAAIAMAAVLSVFTWWGSYAHQLRRMRRSIPRPGTTPHSRDQED